MNRIVHYLFLIEINLLILLASFVALFKKKNKGNKRILTLPYYSQNYAGGQSRIGEWKSLFEKEGWDFNIHWASEEKEFLSEFYSKNPFVRYYFFHKVLLRRINILFNLNKYLRNIFLFKSKFSITSLITNLFSSLNGITSAIVAIAT